MTRVYGDYEFVNICTATGTKYDCDGFDFEGYDEDGFAIDGLDIWLFDRDGVGPAGFYRNGIHSVTGTDADEDGYCAPSWPHPRPNPRKDISARFVFGSDGYNANGVDREGFDREGFDREGFDREGYDRYGINRDGCKRDSMLNCS